jgi:hypothetical protein
MAGATFRRRDKKFSKKMQRTLDPAMLLSRGLSARFVGANVMQSITTLSKEEIEKDLRHMNAYYQANVAYAQQHFIYMNREQLGAAGQLPPPGANPAAAVAPVPAGYPTQTAALVQQQPIAMPVRIDPEEEKRLSNLRKKIALCETQREFLESQYVSLRAHYVATTKELKAASKNAEGLVLFLQTVTQRRARVLACQRARLQIARDVLACLQTRLAVLEAAQAKLMDASAAAGAANHENDKIMDTDSPAKPGSNYNHNNNKADSDVVMKSSVDGSSDDDDIAQIWAELEEMLKEAELACRKVPSSLTISEKKAKKKAKKGAVNPKAEGDDEQTTVGVIPWEGIKMPNTPEGVPLLLSQLSLVPEKGAAFSKFVDLWMASCGPRKECACAYAPVPSLL